MRLPFLGLVGFLGLFAVACGSSGDQGGDAGTQPDGATGDSSTQPDGASKPDGSNPGDGSATTGKVIFVIPMENQDLTKIIGNTTDAPYINTTLVPTYASASNFGDELPNLMSEPHYVWMESGTNAFGDHTFATDSDSSASNSTNSTAHLSTQLDTAGISWTSYQEGITSGTCPISSVSTSFYAAKHDPFVFFQDVSGSPPSASNTRCAMHHKPFSSLVADLQNEAVSSYNYVTPNLCDDMHGALGCPQNPKNNSNSLNIQAGDAWLKTNLQPIVDYALAHDGYVFITWDEGDSTTLMPFIAIGKHSIANHAGTVKYTHSSLLKSEEEILGVPVQSNVASANDFADLFDQGSFP